jgi:hypothetical protein
MYGTVRYEYTDPDPHVSDKLDPDPHQSDLLDLDPNPQSFADDKPKLMEYDLSTFSKF